jgi:hypothetical protein
MLIHYITFLVVLFCLVEAKENITIYHLLFTIREKIGLNMRFFFVTGFLFPYSFLIWPIYSGSNT